jgi:hypothetical protein
MTDAVAAHFAKEAARLLADETFATAMTNVRMSALVALGEVDASDTKEILRLQARANCLQDVRDQLEAAIKAMGSADGGFDPNKPTA